MLKKIQTYFESFIQLTAAEPGQLEHRLNLAAAALLIEMTLQDHEVNDAEVASVLAMLEKKLGLGADESKQLYALADAEKHQATDYHQFTRLIAEHYSQSEKTHLIEALWEVAYADRVLDKYEEHMVRRICDLIYVSHKDFIQAKHRVEARMGINSTE